ncbi:MAG: hypothetical protein IJT28_09615 [Bacteroidaceae bacterium]|nr:hypothetical protein [Bacteroidaceae bacterium]
MGHFEISALIGLLVPIACGCILPIFAIWMGIRKDINESKNRTQVMLAAIEKNPDVDVEELMSKISPKKKLIKEKLLNKLLAGCITTFLGIGLLGYTAYVGYLGGSSSSDIKGMGLAGVILLGVGIALFINYFVGKKLLAKEMEAEEREKTEKTLSK